MEKIIDYLENIVEGLLDIFIELQCAGDISCAGDIALPSICCPPSQSLGVVALSYYWDHWESLFH